MRFVLRSLGLPTRLQLLVTFAQLGGATHGGVSARAGEDAPHGQAPVGVEELFGLDAVVGFQEQEDFVLHDALIIVERHLRIFSMSTAIIQVDVLSR